MSKRDDRIRMLFEGADAGAWSLPAEVMTVRGAFVAAASARDALPRPVDRSVVFERVVSAAVADPDAFDVAELLDHDRRADELTVRREILVEAAVRAELRLMGALHDYAPSIRDGLSAALDELWTRVRAAVEALGDRDPSVRQVMLTAPKAAREAVLTLDEAAHAYAKIRVVAGGIPDGPVTHDHRGQFEEIRQGIHTVWPGWADHGLNNTPPWPSDGGLRLVWLVRHGATPWLPTADQRDRAWLDANPGEARYLANRAEQYANRREAFRGSDLAAARQYAPLTATEVHA